MLTTPAASDVAPSPVALLTRGDAPHSDRAVRTGQLVTVMRGVYADGAAWRMLKPWEKYLARVHAAALKYPDAAFCYESGAALHGLMFYAAHPAAPLRQLHSRRRKLTSTSSCCVFAPDGPGISWVQI